jgi:hypothetical protein
MDLSNILKEKKEKNSELKNKFFLPIKNKCIWLVKISNKVLVKDLRDAFLVLPASFVLEIEWIKTEKLWENIVATWKIETNELVWFDFILCDNSIKNLNKYLQIWKPGFVVYMIVTQLTMSCISLYSIMQNAIAEFVRLIVIKT